MLLMRLMKYTLHRMAIIAACLALPAAAENLPAPTNAASDAKPRDYVRYIGDDKRGRLETVIVTMKKDDVVVDLVGAVHVADPEYYKALTKLFTGYEELLFELVDGQRLKEEFDGQTPATRTKRKIAPSEPAEPDKKNIPKPAAKPDPKDDEDKSPAIKLISSMMHGVGSYFHFQYQTEGIDYHTKNFVHADVSMDEFLR